MFRLQDIYFSEYIQKVGELDNKQIQFHLFITHLHVLYTDGCEL